MTCSPNDVSSIEEPKAPSGPIIPGFGQPFSIPTPNINPFSTGPEDLVDILNKLQLLLPPGSLKPQLNPNYGKDAFDGIMKLLDQFMPFLMMYKMFLPVLNIIICIIEVLCALPNPFKLIRAIRKLFRTCIPDFLNIFPIFALITMIISLLVLLLALVEYIISQIAKFITAILRNIAALKEAYEEDNKTSVIAIAKKLGSLLCIFQNFFVLLSVFSFIIQLFRDILSQSFSIPPCDENSSDCCTSDVCPDIVKTDYTRNTGTFQYLNSVNYLPSLGSPLPSGVEEAFIFPVVKESWQLFDTSQKQIEAFSNIYNAYDVPAEDGNPAPYFKPIFFPTDVTMTKDTSPKQAPYVIDLRMFYNPLSWGRTGVPRHIRFNNCIVLTVPNTGYSDYKNDVYPITNGVVTLAGGIGYEDDGTTQLFGYEPNGTTVTDQPATLENFIHFQQIIAYEPILLPEDGYTFNNIEYTFKPHIEPLLNKNLVTLGCAPDVALTKNFINSVFAGDIALKTTLLNDFINNKGSSNNQFPDPNATQECLSVALDALRADFSTNGVAQFQATTDACLNKLKSDTNAAIGTMIGIGFDPCKSSYSLTPVKQFTSKPIIVSVDLKERNGISIATGLSESVAENLAARIKAHATFGNVTNFKYDSIHSFTAEISSDKSGKGSMMVSFDNNTFCKNVVDPEAHTLQQIDYEFIYTPSAMPSSLNTEGQPRRDESDISRDQ